jgi:tetratricopeptide (TPR) repeat protein
VACSGEPGLVHRWSGVTQSAAAKARGSAAHLAAVPSFAAEFRRAVELDPADATALHLLGRLHFELAGLTWLQRSLASAVFLTPPPATFDDALRYLLAAESAQPGAWKANHQYLAETFVKLGRRDEALAWTRSGLDLPIKALYDQQAHDLLLKLYATIDADACNRYKIEHAGEPTEIIK